MSGLDYLKLAPADERVGLGLDPIMVLECWMKFIFSLPLLPGNLRVFFGFKPRGVYAKIMSTSSSSS